jgi:type II restriction enzyme
MSLNKIQISDIENVLRTALRNKFLNYNPEPAEMPFHTRLIGKDRLALFAFIHSLNTNFGTTVFEPVAKALASENFQAASSQQIAGTHISFEAKRVIGEIIHNLENALNEGPNKIEEIEAIRKVCQSGEMKASKFTLVDLKVIGYDETIYLCDIKTPKPNKGGYFGLKETLLKWVASVLADNPAANVQTYIALPYNPYYPKPYKRWTMRGMIDLKHELKVAEEFWDFLGGEGSYNDLLDIFERVGIELRSEIDEYFSKFNLR